MREDSNGGVVPNKTGAMDPEGAGGSRADSTAPPVTEGPRPWLPFPFKAARFRIWLLGRLFPRRWWIQIGPRIYILREPWEEA